MAQLLRTLIEAQAQFQAQSDLGPEESKAQLEWAPATSKSSPVNSEDLQLSSPLVPEEQCRLRAHMAESSTRTRRQCLVSRHNSNISQTFVFLLLFVYFNSLQLNICE